LKIGYNLGVTGNAKRGKQNGRRPVANHREVIQLNSFSGIVLGALLALALPGMALSQTDKGPVGLSVTGTGEVKAMPDIAYVSIGVQTRENTAAEAARTNAEKITAVIAAIKKAGVGQKDIETQRYSVQPAYDYRQNPPTLLGYDVTNTVRVTVHNLDKIGTIIDAATAAGANNVQGVTFDIENEQALRNEALTKAIQDASSKADAMAAALKVRKGSVLSASESTQPLIRPMLEMGAVRGAAAPTPISPQQITVTSTVQITYGILAG
jgi:uncharacterized protein YggE